MIHGHDDLLLRLGAFGWKPDAREYGLKVTSLGQAIWEAVHEAIGHFGTDEVPTLALSGGVDSSVLAMVLAQMKVPRVRLLTMTVTADHPDMVHAGRIVGLLPKSWEWLRVVRAPDAGQRKDSYHYLMQAAVALGIRRMINGDCIDELMGGYYDHLDNGETAFWSRLADLIPGHLNHMEEFSTLHGVTVHLPYGSAGVMEAAQAFHFHELVSDGIRKRPMMAMARAFKVPEENILRRKLGLVSWTKGKD